MGPGNQHGAQHHSRAKRVKLDPGLDDPKPGSWIYPAPIYGEMSHQENISTEDDSNFSAETFEDSLAATAAKGGSKKEQIWKFDQPVAQTMLGNGDSTVGLDLTLGLNRV